MYEMQKWLYTELYDAIQSTKLRARMHQNTCVDFRLEYLDAKSDAIAFCVVADSTLYLHVVLYTG